MSRKDADFGAQITRTSHRLLTSHVGWIVIAIAVVAVALQFRQVEGNRTAKAQAPQSTAGNSAPSPEAGPIQHDVMAIVNGQDISRQALTDACMQKHGKEVLESLVNKSLILSHCEKRQIKITPEDIHAEIDRMAARFKVGREQWFELLQQERNITPEEYARDIVWPTLALRRLAASEVEPTPEEFQRAMEKQFGEKIQARLIAISNREKADQIHAELVADPEKFARLAIEHSVDVNSASIGGLIQPISRHVGDATIEQTAFGLQPGQISPVLEVAGQFVILKCEERIPPRQVQAAAVQAEIVEKIKDEKLRGVAQTLFAKLQETATIQNVYNNPQLRETLPGVVATVNGDRITLGDLGKECLTRHGEEVLETQISQLLLSQAMKKAGVTLTQEDTSAEMRHAAELAGVVDSNGNADLTKWLRLVTEEQGISEDDYYRNALWPSAALKKLAASEVTVDEEDLQKGFEANYGERVRCRAIVLGNMRRAQEVWDKARRNPTLVFFGDLAEQYSVEPTSKALRGEVPPLQKFGGQPQLEEVAFSLEPGQLSGIVQVGEKFIILRCEGRTERIDVNMAEVRDILYRDIHEKKLRLAMTETFERIRSQSRIDNYLAGTSTAPKGQAEVHHDTAVRPVAGTR